MFAQTKSDYATRAYNVVTGFPMALSCASTTGARLQPGIGPYTMHAAAYRMNNTRLVALWLEGGIARIQSVRMAGVGRVVVP